MAAAAAPPRRRLAFVGGLATCWAILLIAICAAAAAQSSRAPAQLPAPAQAALARERGAHVHAAGVLQPVVSRPPDTSADNTTGWHPTRIDNSELVPLGTIQPGRLEVVQHPASWGRTPALAKLAPDAHEAAVYRLLQDLGVAPRFLGHVTEEGRIVGLLTEYVGQVTMTEQQQEEKEGDEYLVQIALVSRRRRLDACLSALRRMHARGIAHGDAHGGNCLLRADGSAALIDFELAVETTSRAEFDRDLWIMSHTVDD